MAHKTITTQAQLDKLKEIKSGDSVTIDASLRLSGILHVYGSLTINKPLDCNWYEDRHVRAWGSATVRASGSATVRASGSATVEASGSATVRAWGSATVSLLGFAIGIVFPSVKFELKSDFAKIVKRDQVFKTKKKTIVYKKLGDGHIATLELPKGAVFQSEYNAKCRTASAMVLNIDDGNGKEFTEGYSGYNENFIYTVGRTVDTDYDEDIEECSTGIHFFLDRESAERY